MKSIFAWDIFILKLFVFCLKFKLTGSSTFISAESDNLTIFNLPQLLFIYIDHLSHKHSFLILKYVNRIGPIVFSSYI